MKSLFKDYAINENNYKWDTAISRKNELYNRNNMRSPFERDYTRIIHCNAYKRLKHKTQVFFSPNNDHICTRVEHVTHVESISYTMANTLGLNVELTRAIATAHDLGHSPFGHQGEKVLSEISMRDIGETFWHEKNGLDYVDKIGLLEDNFKNKQNLNLTYAVRDGIISHCGEIDENGLKPREEAVDLDLYKNLNQYPPYTWEGCVVKLADKIAYLGRDIEDAVSLGILDEHLKELYGVLQYDDIINNTVIINDLIWDVCNNSSVEKGLCFSKEKFNLLKDVKLFNYKNIYLADRMKPSIRYFKLVLNEIYNTLKNTYDKEKTLENIHKMEKVYPKLFTNFEDFLSEYWNLERKEIYKNDILFDIYDEKQYCKAIIYYISGMTDNFAIETYNEIIRF